MIHNQMEWGHVEKSGMVCKEKVDTESEYTVGVFSDGRNVNSIILKQKLGLGYGNTSSGLSIEVIVLIYQKKLLKKQHIAYNRSH